MIKVKNIIIASAVLVLLVATLIIIQFVKPGVASSNNSTDTQSTKLFDHAETDCKTITIKNINNEYVINNVDGTWEIQGMATVSKDAISTVISDIVNISATKIADSLENLSDYGLDNPQATVTILLNDGSTSTFLLGNAAPISNTFYLKKDGDNSIYTVYSGIESSINTKFEDKRDTSIDMVATDKITLISLKQEGKKEILLRGVFGDNSTNATSVITGMSMDQPYPGIQLDPSKTDGLINNISAFTLNEVVEENVSDFSKYGLDKPKLELMVMDSNNKALKVTAGNQDENGQYYVRVNDGKTVYKAFKQLVENISINPYDLVNKIVYSVNIDDINDIKIENGGNTYTLKITKQDSGYKYALNDNELDDTKGNALYQAIASMVTDGECANDVSLNTVMKITYDLKNGTQTVIEFKEYDDNFYRVYVNGVSYFVSSKDYIKNIVNKLS